MRQQREPGVHEQLRPPLQLQEAAVAISLEPLDVVTPRVRAEEDAPGRQRGVQLGEDAGQIGARDVEQRRVAEDPVEGLGGEIEREEVLVQHLAPRVRARHLHEARGPVEARREVAAARELGEVTARAAAEVEDPERRRASARQRVEERVEVLRHVVIARPLPEALGVGVVVREGAAGLGADARS